ncbi:hypothetical protein GOBAR_AA34533 [Gossypium barbadense]|uniref:Uncharacterized protein n=1 Tax=Gossypium barbadense TaxID=3634 RepID=A0A2P5W526_GOSBA|nr:hypothetical protein GOBAR_AA34533 [Gossypium barbadense]
MFPLAGIQYHLHVVKRPLPCFKEKEGSVIFLGSTAKVRHPFLRFPIGPQEELFQILRARPLITSHCIDWAVVKQVQLAKAIRALLTTNPWELFFGIIEPTYLELTMEFCSIFHLQTLMINYDDLGMVQFLLDGLVHQLNVPEFGTALGLCIEEFKEENDLHALNRHIHHSSSRCWDALVPGGATYNPSHFKASALPPSLSHDAYFLWCISHEHVIDLAYFITLSIQHQTERHRKGVISISPYVTQLAQHFGLLDIAAQESSLTLIGQMSPQGISSMLSMRMIEKRRGTYLPQYRLTQSTEEEAYEDIPDDVPPQYEDPQYQPPPPSRPVIRWLHMLTFLSASLDSSSSVFNDLITLMLLYSRFVSTSTSHCQSHLANHPAMKYIELLSSSSHRNYKLDRERFSTTAMSCSTTTIATTRYNILLA